MKITNSDTVKELQEAAGLQFAMDMEEKDIQKLIVPTIEINPKLLRFCNIVKNATASNATAATIFTTPANQDFYLLAAQMSMIKDASATSLASSIDLTPEGAQLASIMVIRGISLTAQNDSLTISFPVPLKLERNTTITINNTTATATVVSSGMIVGFIDYIKK